MIVLAIDTALSACQAAVIDDGRVLAVACELMERGHQERLAPLVQVVMSDAGLGFDRLDRLAVTVGPGSFTGVRVGLAFAKAAALALDRPCLGIGTLEALAAGEAGFVAAAIDGRRGQVYLQAFLDQVPVMAPDVLPLDEAPARLAELYRGGPAVLVGPGAGLLEGFIRDARPSSKILPDPVALARLAAERRSPTARATPLYLRAPDARTIAERAQAKP